MAAQLESLQHAVAKALDDAEQEQSLLARLKPSSPSSTAGLAQANEARLSSESVATDSDDSMRECLALSLAVHPACAAIASDYVITDIWLAHQPGGIFPRRVDVPSRTVVVRPAWQPTVLVQSEATHVAFVALQSGDTLNQALEAALAVDPEFDFVSQWQAWISTCAITGAAQLRDPHQDRLEGLSSKREPTLYGVLHAPPICRRSAVVSTRQRLVEIDRFDFSSFP